MSSILDCTSNNNEAQYVKTIPGRLRYSTLLYVTLEFGFFVFPLQRLQRWLA
jgi:hypothetical protein